MLRRFQQQAYQQIPFGLNIDWSNPICKQLCFATVFNDRGRASVQNLVTSKYGTLSGTYAWDRQGIFFPGGVVGTATLDFGTEAATQDFGKTADGSNPYSFIYRINLATANTSVARRNDNNTVSAGWELFFNTGSFGLVHESSVGNMTVAASNSLIANGQWNTCGICSDGTQTAANHTLFLNGRGPLAHASNINGSGTPASDSAQSFQLGRGSAVKNNATFNGDIDFFYAWRRQLEGEEVIAIMANPSLIFNPSAFLISQAVANLPGGKPFTPSPPTGVVTVLTAGTVYAMPPRIIDISYSTAGASILEGSFDGDTFFTLDSQAVGAGLWVFKGWVAPFIRPSTTVTVVFRKPKGKM